MELFKLLGTIAIDNTEANNALRETSQNAEETNEAFGKIGKVAGTIAKGIGVAGLAIGGAFIGAVEGTREYRAEMNLLDAAFQTAGHSSKAAKDTYSELNAVLGDSGQAVEASQHLAKLVDNEKDLQTWTDICAGVYATFGESIPLESLTESANEVAKSGVLTGGLVDALVWAGISEEEFQAKLDACSTEQERQNLIMETLNGKYKDASVQYKETNKDIIASRQAQERLSDAMAKVGEIGEPVMTAVRNAIASLAEKAIPVLEDMVTWFQDAITWIKQNEETVQAWVGVIIGATTAIGTFILIISWGKIMTAAANAIKVVRTAMIGFNAVLMANPVGLVVAALAGLVAAFIYLWNNVEGFRNFWKSAWNTIKSLANSAWKAIRKYFSDAWAAIKKTWSAVTGYFRGIWNGIKSTFNSVKSWFSQIFRNAWNGVKSIWNGARSFFSGIWSGIRGVFGSVASWFRNTFRNAWNNIKSVFSGWGSFFSGLWSKVKSKFGSIGTSIGSAMGNAVKNGMNGALSKVESAINKGIGLINSAIRLANKLPGINVGTVSKISLPRLAKGGVLEQGQVGILEGSGAEAVVPLENNRAWLSRVAEDLHDIQMTKQPGSNIDILPRLNRIIELLENLFGMQIRLDSGALVGELAPAVDARLGRMYRTASRGR
jgi:phage-related protein